MSAVRKTIHLTLGILAIAVPAFAMSGEGCGGDCASCHSMTVQEANGLLKEIGKVTAVKPAAVRGLYEITLERGGQTAVGYLDYGKKHLMGGQIFDLTTRQVVGAPPVKPPAEHLDPATLETADSLLLGNPKGKKHLFVFTDPECPYCAKLHAELQKLVGMEPDLAVHIKLLPLTKLHPQAYDKARVILGENSLKLLEQSFAKKPLRAPGKKDRKEPIDKIMQYAEKAGIVATPTLVLADGRIIPGFKEAAAIRDLLK